MKMPFDASEATSVLLQAQRFPSLSGARGAPQRPQRLRMGSPGLWTLREVPWIPLGKMLFASSPLRPPSLSRPPRPPAICSRKLHGLQVGSRGPQPSLGTAGLWNAPAHWRAGLALIMAGLGPRTKRPEPGSRPEVRADGRHAVASKERVPTGRRCRGGIKRQNALEVLTLSR